MAESSTPTAVSVRKLAEATKRAQRKLMGCHPEARQQVLLRLAKELEMQKDAILEANEQDCVCGEEAGLSSAMLDRLRLNPSRIQAMIEAVRAIEKQPEVVGLIEHEWMRPDGLKVIRQRIPLGVVGMIFESRPNVVIEAAALALKSGNGMLLKGGKEARFSNEALAICIERALEGLLPTELIQLLPSDDREASQSLMTLNGLVDVLIPRGGESLIRYVMEHATVPVIAHYKGLCHLYIHGDANLEQAVTIAVNAKAQRPGVCNALETLLVDTTIAETALPMLESALQDVAVALRGCARVCEILPKCAAASEADWDTEYLDRILSIRVVEGVEGAIDHIAEHGTGHTEAICAVDETIIQRFVTAVDASCVTINASTRFNDGGQLGLGAELGISTSKLHAYGPMGAKEMTTVRFVVRGKGHIRS